jgi:alpha-L-rhamnosidase
VNVAPKCSVSGASVLPNLWPLFASGRHCKRALYFLQVAVLILSVPVLAAQQSSAPTTKPALAANITELQRLFENPPADSRIMMRWWWFGPSVAKSELEREMKVMKEGGIGGFEVQPVYPLALDDQKNIRTLRFLSDEFLDALHFTSAKSRDLGLRMDLTLGSGWPYGGPQVPITEAAGMLRWERVKINASSRRVPLPYIGSGEKFIAAFLAASREQSIDPQSLEELTIIKDGAVELPSNLNGPHEVLLFVSSRTGMMVKRAAVGAEGFVVDHYDRAALENYLKNVGDRLIQAFDSNPPYSIFCDSLEVYQSDWTGDFLQEFQRRRGYDLKPLLPALVMDFGDKTKAVRYDWGKTLTELFNERFATPLHDWAQQNHTLLRMQGYGIPPAELSTNALVDLPEGEGSQWKTLSATRWASSASHLYGRPVTSSETWTWLHSPVFRATPLDMKAEADRHFLEGINQLIGHGWPYTAEGVEYPGWRFYAAAVFDEDNPWWITMPDIALYLQRLSFLLRQGQPVNDIAVYLPNSDAWAHFSPGQVDLIEALRQRIGSDVVARILESGFNFDFFDDTALKQIGRIENNALVLGPNHYRAVVLPGIENIPLDTLHKLEHFARSGGILIATRRLPDRAPGLSATETEHNEIRQISRTLFEGASAPGHFVTDEDHQLKRTLTGLLQPDVSLSPPVNDIGFVHRKTEDAGIYFVANTSNSRQQFEATFRIQAMRGEWWDPLTGNVSPALAKSSNDHSTTVSFDLEPYGSRLLVFSKRTLPQRRAARISHLPAAMDLSSGWQVSFGEGNPPVAMDRLQSWTENQGTRFFSGVATYEKTVGVPEGMLKAGIALRLDLGEGKPIPEFPAKNGMQAWFEPPVREAAVIYINDKKAGSVWCPPYSLDVTRLLRPGENKIKIVVGNLAINYMAGHALPDYRLLNLRYGARFQAQDMDTIQAVPAGLLGPVRLIPVPE